jgi:phenylpyruvate tautomerase PptA (4-oxalocrotonate tautomerase family)
MPSFDITVIGDPPSERQKRAVFDRITSLMVDVLGRTKKLVVVSVRTSPAVDWSAGGNPAGVAGLIGIQGLIRIVAGSCSDEQKARVVADSTAALREELGDPTMPLYILFDEVPAASWGYGGRTIADIRAQGNAG